jgi:hypothetical protein
MRQEDEEDGEGSEGNKNNRVVRIVGENGGGQVVSAVSRWSVQLAVGDLATSQGSADPQRLTRDPQRLTRGHSWFVDSDLHSLKCADLH